MAEKPTPGRSIFANPLLRDSALVSNVIDLVDKQKQSNLANGQPVRHAIPRDTRIKIKNSSGADRVRGEVLDVGSMLLTNLDRRAKWFDGDTPDGTSLFAVLLQPLLDGQIGEAQLLGVCMARVNVSNTSHTHAASANGSCVLASGTEGAAQILYHTGSTGVQNCFVLLCCEGSSEEWTVEDLEAESDITHTGAVQYGTASGDYTIDSAGNVIVDATSDITFKVGSTPTTVFQIDESAKTITLGTGSYTIGFNWNTGVWQPAVGVRGLSQWVEATFSYTDFQDAAQTKTIDTGINLPSGAILEAGQIQINTVFDDGAGNDFTISAGRDAANAGDDNAEYQSTQAVDTTASVNEMINFDDGAGAEGPAQLPKMNYRADEDWDFTLTMETTTAANLNALTQGSLTVRYKISVP